MVPSICQIWYYATQLGQHRRELFRTRSLVDWRTRMNPVRHKGLFTH